MNVELHIIIVWHNALEKVCEIEKTISKKLIILKKIEYLWDEKNASKNFAAFYGEKLENIQYKVEHCGSGYFILFIVRDDAPKYEARNTTSGERIVNTNLFDLKSTLRKITGGGHIIHASDTQQEANTNSISLFGKCINEYVNKENSNVQAVPIETIRRNISGVCGWVSWEELFDILGKGTKYVVLRNYETLLSKKKSEHGDTDILVLDRQIANTLIGGSKEYLGKDRVLISTIVDGNTELIDIRYCDDGYYCSEWEHHIIENRRLAENSYFYIPNDEDKMYSLLYHALVHKPFISNGYLNDMMLMFSETSENKLRTILHNYMNKKGYYYTMPIDKSVYINPVYFKYIKVPFGRRIYCTLKKVKYWRKYDEKKENKYSKKIHSLLNRGYYLALNTLRKIKSRIKR
ncbi:MAG: hypothetical protein KO464_02750 [Candidatus Methanofastidiosum sp.]|nr:hypothetical protein [Methanofastidiosum sp.]